MRIFFVRHGQTNYNVLNLCNDDPTKEVHLTQTGKKQARKAGEKIKDIELDLVVVSELPRTKETALLIIADRKLPFQIEPRINDRKTGYEGKPVDEFQKALRADIFHASLPGGESFQDEKKRVFSFLEKLKQYSMNTILVVTHAEILKIIYGYFECLTDKEMWEKEIDNCHVLEIKV